MAHTDNYLIQVQQAKKIFLTYDQEKLIRKLQLAHDAAYLYPVLFRQTYRLDRKTGDLQRQEGETWVDANTFGEVMTLLDLICDSREDRFLSGAFQNMASFGRLFHTSLLEEGRDPWAELFQENPEGLRRACQALGGRPLPNGDIAYAIEIFDGLEIALQFWFADEDFPPSLRLMWDENALMYIRYETMYYARDLLLQMLKQRM